MNGTLTNFIIKILTANGCLYERWIQAHLLTSDQTALVIAGLRTVCIELTLIHSGVRSTVQWLLFGKVGTFPTFHWLWRTKTFKGKCDRSWIMIFFLVREYYRDYREWKKHIEEGIKSRVNVLVDFEKGNFFHWSKTPIFDSLLTQNSYPPDHITVTLRSWATKLGGKRTWQFLTECGGNVSLRKLFSANKKILSFYKGAKIENSKRNQVVFTKLTCFKAGFHSLAERRRCHKRQCLKSQ